MFKNKVSIIFFLNFVKGIDKLKYFFTLIWKQTRGDNIVWKDGIVLFTVVYKGKVCVFPNCSITDRLVDQTSLINRGNNSRRATRVYVRDALQYVVLSLAFVLKQQTNDQRSNQLKASK